MKTNKILYNYLSNSDIKVDLGATKELSKEEGSNNYNALKLELEANSSLKNKLIIVIYLVLSIFFFFCLYLFFLVKSDPDKIKYIFGGSVFSILAAITPMINIWKDKERTDTILKVLPFLKEEDRITAIMGFLKLSETKG
ncbi:MAG TPA: hypothetical protein VJY62_11145 [Bacteroidia bacterium]|nr:hypothetical protein [Bacteroidia bacterium]